MTAIDKIRESIITLSEVGDKKLASDLLCALAAITDAENPRVDLTYSAIMRELRSKHKDSVKDFQIKFKDSFEEALDNDIEDPEKAALMDALQALDLEV